MFVPRLILAVPFAGAPIELAVARQALAAAE
jgi:hypothetical protein